MRDEHGIIDISTAGSNNIIMRLSNIPDLSFYIKSIQIPDITMNPVHISSPLHTDWEVQSVKTVVNQITIMYYLDERMITYFTLLSWLKKLRSEEDIKKHLQDVSLLILNNAKMPMLRLTLIDSWLNMLGTIDTDTQSANVQTPYFILYSSEIQWEYLIDVPDELKEGKF